MCVYEVFVMNRLNADAASRDRSDYQRRYYEDNCESLSERRKKLYQEDPEYRQAILDRVAEYRENKRKERAKLQGQAPQGC